MSSFLSLLQSIADVAAVVLAVGALAAAVVAACKHNWKKFVRNVAKWTASPPARTCDALIWLWTLRKRPTESADNAQRSTFKRKVRTVASNRGTRAVACLIHFLFAAGIPVGAIILAHEHVIETHGVAFGLAGLAAGTFAELPDFISRNHLEADSDDKWFWPLRRTEVGIGGTTMLFGLLTAMGAGALYVVPTGKNWLAATGLGFEFGLGAAAATVASTILLASFGGWPFTPVSQPQPTSGT